MPTTLLAVDDSVTMRKVIEITFAGEDFRVVTAESADAALKKARAEKPQIVLLDVTLPEMDGYAVCRTLKQEFPGIGVVMLSAKQGPYDAGRGSAAGADDFIDKPFDTQQMIEKVKKVALAKANAPAAAAPPPPRPVAPSAPQMADAPKPGGTLPGTSAPSAPVRPPAPPVPAAAVNPKATAIFAGGGPPPAAPAVPQRPPAPTPVAGMQRPTPVAASPSPPAAAAAPPAPPPEQPATQPAIAAAVDGQMGEKLAKMGLNPQQADAVLALSREVVERIVWEVVPVLAETIIKEELRRLTSEA